MPEPLATLSIDLDTVAGDMRGLGDERLRDRCYATVLPRLLDLLERLELPATLFVIGTDAARPHNAALLKEAAARGHELASHSLEHDRRLPLLPRRAIERDVRRSGEIIGEVAGSRPVGFRTAGATVSRELLEVLASHGYLYDSSVNPSLVYGLAKGLHGALFRTGAPTGIGALAAPATPYLPGSSGLFRHSPREGLGILEIPLTTVPGLSLPFMSYFLLESPMLSSPLVRLTTLGRTFINLVLHDHELADLHDFRGSPVPRTLVTTSMKTDLGARLAATRHLLRTIRTTHRFVTMTEYATSHYPSGAR